MPTGKIQFEIGIQSLNPDVLSAVGRKSDPESALRNIRRLVSLGNCHIHADLIALLPHETFASFQEGFDKTIAGRPHVLQLGFLKLLHGSRLREEASRHGYRFMAHPPHEAFSNQYISYDETILLKGVAEVVDTFYNSGLFDHSVNFALSELFDSAFAFFLALKKFLEETDADGKLSQKNAYERLMAFLLRYAPEDAVHHFIKLDALTFDAKYIKPAVIPSLRDKEAESRFRKNSPEKVGTVVAEYFPYDDKKRIFIYDSRNPVTKAYLTLTE